MDFEEWYNEDNHDLYNYPAEAMKEAWSAAIDEAVKVAGEKLVGERIDGWASNPDIYVTYKCDIAKAIKELKE